MAPYFFFCFYVRGGPLLNIWNRICHNSRIHQSYNVISNAKVEPVLCRAISIEFSKHSLMRLICSCLTVGTPVKPGIWKQMGAFGVRSVEGGNQWSFMHPYHWLVKHTLYKVIREAELRATWVFQSGCWDIVFCNPA